MEKMTAALCFAVFLLALLGGKPTAGFVSGS